MTRRCRSRLSPCLACRYRDALILMAELHLAAGLGWAADAYLTALVVQAGGAVA